MKVLPATGTDVRPLGDPVSQVATGVSVDGMATHGVLVTAQPSLLWSSHPPP
jgi:hypothetical protein